MTALYAQINYREGFEEAWEEFIGFAPRLLAALAVLLVGWIVANLIRRLLTRALTRVRFQDLIEKSGLHTPLARVGVKNPSRLLATLIYWSAMLLVLQLAIDTFGETAIQNALDDLIGFLPNLFIGIIIIVVVGAIATRVASVLNELLENQGYGTYVARAASTAIWVVGLFAAMNQVEIADDVLNILFVALVATIGATVVVMFGISGIQAARDRFWPSVFDRIGTADSPQQADQP